MWFVKPIPIERAVYCKKTAHFRLARLRATPLRKLCNWNIMLWVWNSSEIWLLSIQNNRSYKENTQVVSPFPIQYEEFVARTAVVRFYLRRTCILFSLHVHFISVTRAFHLRRTCVFSRITRVTWLYFSSTTPHPGVEMGTCKMQESKKLDERLRIY